MPERRNGLPSFNLSALSCNDGKLASAKLQVRGGLPKPDKRRLCGN